MGAGIQLRPSLEPSGASSLASGSMLSHSCRAYGSWLASSNKALRESFREFSVYLGLGIGFEVKRAPLPQHADARPQPLSPQPKSLRFGLGFRLSVEGLGSWFRAPRPRDN